MLVCPDKQTWESKTKYMCQNPDEEYHCMFDTECKLVEDCRQKQSNSEIGLYFINQNITNFEIKTVPVMSSNDPDYHKLQQATFCKNASNVSKSTPGDYHNNTSVSNNTIDQNTDSSGKGWEECCKSFVPLFIISAALAFIIPFIIYRKIRYKQHKERSEEGNSLIEKNNELDRVKKENCDFKEQLSQLKEEKKNIEAELHKLQPKYMNGEQHNIQSHIVQESSPFGRTVPVFGN